MRLTTSQVQAIRHAGQCVLGDGARASVCGSMALNDSSGGDIDLLFETDNKLANRAKTLCHVYGGRKPRNLPVHEYVTDAGLFLQALLAPKGAAQTFCTVAAIETQASTIGLSEFSPAKKLGRS